MAEGVALDEAVEFFGEVLGVVSRAFESLRHEENIESQRVSFVNVVSEVPLEERVTDAVQIRVGAQDEQGHYVLATGDPADPNLPVQSFTPYHLRDYFVRLTYDRLDDINFPRRGQQAVVQWDAYRNASGIVQSADQITASYLGAYSFGRDTLAFSAAGGTTLQANVTDLNLQFPLGGFLNLSALRADSLLGPNFGIARALFYRQIGRGGPGYFDLPTYLGVSLEMGNVWQTRSAASFGNTERDASVWLGVDTFIGPIYIATGFDTHGNQQYYLFLGRPFYGGPR